MGRFAARVLAFTVGATIFWWLTRSATAAWTVEGAKLLHRLVGAPAPFLILEVLDYWWLAPPVQFFVGLTLAATWLGWRRRLLALFVGIYLLWLVVMMGVVSMSSPYLGPSSMRTVISSILTNGHLIIAPIIFWLILVGIPPATVIQAWSGGTTPRADDSPGASPRWWPRTVVAFMVCSAVSVVVYAPALAAAPEVKQARRALCDALRAGDDRQAIYHALLLRKIQRELTMREDPSLYYLLGRLAERYGNRELADKCLFHPAIDPRVQAAIRKGRVANRQRTSPAYNSNSTSETPTPSTGPETPTPNTEPADSARNTIPEAPTQQPPAEAGG